MVIGRDGELDAIERFLAELGEQPAVLVLEGEAGIGKTTLVRAAVEAAQRRGARVLSCTASTSETRLSYAALTDLLAGIGADALEALPAPQRDALDAALLRAGSGSGSGSGDAGVDARAVATAVLSLLRALAEEAPVLVAIDDLQWLDRPSARVVEFCARRLSGLIGLVAAVRVDGDGRGAERTRGVRAAAGAGAGVRRIGPLAAGPLERLVRERSAAPLERRALARVREASGGNPFYALELARALPADGRLSPALELPASLDEIVGARMAGLGPETEEALLAVATLADPTVELVERALGPGAGRLLDEAEDRGMIELDGRRVRFSHPLLANGVYARAQASRRRAMHRRLAAAVPGIEERARHLAYGGVVPAAIPALDEAARHARARGAPTAAAELLELALDLGGAGELRVRAAEHHFDAGDSRRARELLEHAIADLAPCEIRAQALLLAAEVHYKDDSFPEARALLERARTETGAGERLRVLIDLRLTFTLFSLEGPPAAAAAVRSALAGAERLGDPPLLAEALATSAMIDFCLGLGVDDRRLARALALEDPDTPGTRVEFRPSLIAACLFQWTGRFEEARARLSDVCAHFAARGDEHALAWACFIRTGPECWAGDLAAASEAAEEGLRRLLVLGTVNGRALGLAARARVDAYAGRVEQARRGCEEALALFTETGWNTWAALPLTTLGFLELSVGDEKAAAVRVAAPALGAASNGQPEPVAGGVLMAGDAAEALVAVGRIGEAEIIVSWLQERGAALDRTWAIAVGARCRGLLHAAAGDVAGAERALEDALIAHERLPMPIERARSLLVMGRIRRRRRRRRAAHAALAEALQIFEAVGSCHWAERAREELACVGLRAGPADELTPSEQRVARLTASGLSNREVAAALYMSPKTVEAHLTRIYRKLEIHSRAELGARMARREHVAPALAE